MLSCLHSMTKVNQITHMLMYAGGFLLQQYSRAYKGVSFLNQNQPFCFYFIIFMFTRRYDKNPRSYDIL